MTTTVERTGIGNTTAADAAPWRRGAGVLLGIVVTALGIWSATVALDGDATGAQLVRAGLVAAWGVCAGIAATRHRGDPTPLLLLVAAFFAGLATLASETLATGNPILGRSGAEVIRAAGVAFAPAFVFHSLIAMPSGVLRSSARRTLTGIGYALAAVLSPSSARRPR
jgi:hypothetical protein